MRNTAFFSGARLSFHTDLLKSVLLKDGSGVPSNADKDSAPSVKIAAEIMKRLPRGVVGARPPGQSAGKYFEEVCKAYLEATFLRLVHMRPGQWKVSRGVGGQASIAQFDQYEHLAALEQLAKASRKADSKLAAALGKNSAKLAAALGSDYLIKPDVLVIRYPEPDRTINAKEVLVDDEHSRLTPLRRANSSLPILHASVSCKWTIRSDRSQNSRAEALNLVRNRKGRLPHVVVVTGEPLPSRIASIALGTGDIDCVYHFALDELREAVDELRFGDAKELLKTMVDGKRLRDISDLPLDLVI